MRRHFIKIYRNRSFLRGPQENDDIL